MRGFFLFLLGKIKKIVILNYIWGFRTPEEQYIYQFYWQNDSKFSD